VSNLRKLALSHDNIAKVHSNVREDYNPNPSALVVKEKPDWKLRKHNRFANNLLKVRKDGSIDEIIKAVGNSSPIYNNTLRNEHLLLLMASQSVISFSTLARYSNGTIYILVRCQLLEVIPHIPGIKSKRAFLSYKGFQLLDHWNEKYKRFQSYYNAFVNEDIRGKAKEYSVIRAIGGVHKDIKEVAEINTELDRKIIKREKTFKMQRTLQDSIGKKGVTDFTTGSTVTTTTFPLQQNILTTLSSTGTLTSMSPSNTGGLLGSLFGGK